MYYVSVMIVQDNFFDNPNEIRSLALSDKIDYQRRSQGFKYEGIRSQCLSSVDKNFFNAMCGYFISTLYNFNSPFTFTANLFFHINTASDMKDDVYNDMNRRIHKDDGVLMTGMVYLSPTTPKRSGTILYDEKLQEDIVIENKYNRALMFESGNIYHSIGNLFGSTKENGRMTLLCFVQNVEFVEAKR